MKVNKEELLNDLNEFYYDYILERDKDKVTEEQVKQTINQFCPIRIDDLEHVEIELDSIRCVQGDLNIPANELLKDRYQERLDDLWDRLNWLKDEYELENNLPF